MKTIPEMKQEVSKKEDLELFYALKQGDFEKADELIANGKDINCGKFLRMTPFLGKGDKMVWSWHNPPEFIQINHLEQAFLAKRLDIVEFLLSRGADYVNLSEKISTILSSQHPVDIYNALVIIIKYTCKATLLYEQFGFQEGNILHSFSENCDDFYCPLSKKRISPKETIREGQKGTYYPYPDFINEETNKFIPWLSTDQLQTLLGGFLLDKVTVNMQDEFGNTPLHKAVKKNNLPMVAWLMQTNLADLAIPDKEGKTALQLAETNPEMQRLLVPVQQDRISLSANRFTLLNNASYQDAYSIIVNNTFS